MLPAGPAITAGHVLEVSGQGEELLFMLFPHLRGLRVERVEDAGDAVVIRACCRAAQARCPACGAVSSRVHGGYARVVADGAAGGRPVLVVLSVRRFRCPDPSCPKVTFAEQAEGVSARYRRRSVPLLGMLAGFGLELAGRAAARLAGTLGVPVHSSTVLRLVMALPDPPAAAAPAVTDCACGATTIRERRNEWIKAGIFAELKKIARESYDRMAGLALEELAVDGCITKAPGGGQCAGPSPVDRRKLGMKRSLLVEGYGIPLGRVLAPANRHDSPLLAPHAGQTHRDRPAAR